MGRDRGLALRAGQSSTRLEPGKIELLQSAFDAVCKLRRRDVDLIASVPIQTATSQSEIRRVLAALLTGCGRSPVVFTEGFDSSPQDWGSDS